MQGVYIPQIDCKDLWLSNYGYGGAFSLKKADGSLNLRRFRSVFDYSLDLLKLREVYDKVYNNKKFSTIINEKEYCGKIINVTFEYSVKEYNRCGSNTYVRIGYDFSQLEFEDCACIQNNMLAGIKLNVPVKNPLSDERLAPYFCFDGECYRTTKKIIKTLKSVADIRRELYEKGFMIDGTKYVRWKRSAGSARVGRCLFVERGLYGKIHEWESCGLNISQGDEVDLAAFESYISLTSSSMIDTLDLEPSNILVIDDYNSIFEDDVICVTESEGVLDAEPVTTTIENCIFDGQALIDKSALGKYDSKGMVLLRNRFFKSCAFNCNLQQWFKDNGITSVEQLNGKTRATDITEIKLVTTPSSIKFCKFGTIDEWLDKLEPKFGLVKYEKPPHFFKGKMVQAHYQLINSIQMSKEEVEEFLRPTFEFMTNVRKYPAVLRYWINFNINELDDITPVKSKTDVIYKLMSTNDKFTKTKLYYDFRADFLKSFTKNLKCGHVLVNGNYSTICGNPIEMLKYTIGTFDGTTEFKPNTVYCKRFEFGKELLGSRSPHITFSNVLCTKNERYPNIEKYMNPTDEIVYVNSIGENILEQLAGCDFDSDTIMITDNEILIKAAHRNNNKFKVAVNKVGGLKINRRYTSADQADLDTKTSKNLIGEIINVSQELNTRVWDILAESGTSGNVSDGTLEKVQDIYLDICKLSIMSNIEIDKAKKEYAVNNGYELDLIRKKHKLVLPDGRQVKPFFFSHIAKRKGYYDPERKAYVKHDTSMDYLQTCVNSYRLKHGRNKKKDQFKIIPFSEMIDCESAQEVRNAKYSQINDLFDFIDDANGHISSIYANKTVSEEYKRIIANSYRQDCIDRIGELSFSPATMKAMLKMIEQPKHSKHRKLIFYTLFAYPNTAFFEVLKKSKSKIPYIEQDPAGDIEIFGVRFKLHK